jgi:multiple sugar transport system substrate-binding protein
LIKEKTMHTKIRSAVLLGWLLVLALVLAACAGGGSAPAGQEQGEATTGEATTGETTSGEAAEGVTELQLMGWSSSEAENTRLQEVIDGFNEANPDLQVTLNLVPEYDTKLQTAIAGGTPPDVFYLDSFRVPDLVDAGAVAPIGDQLTDPDDFYPNLRDAFTIDGTFYCPPKDFGTLALQYNTALFEAAGVEPPTADWTWDDLRSAAEALTDQEAGVYGLVLPSDFARWIVFLYQAGGSVTNEDFTSMTINSPEALEALNFYVSLVRDGFAAQPSDLDSGWPGEAFGKGRAAMTIEGNWIVPFLQDQFPDLQYGISELPAGPAGRATMAFTVCYAVPANAANPEASLRLVDYLTGPEGMKAWTDLGLAMPTRASLREGWLEQFPNLEPFLNGADYAYKWQFRPGFNDVLDTVNNGLQQAFAGSMRPEDVLAEAESVGNEVLSR